MKKDAKTELDDKTLNTVIGGTKHITPIDIPQEGDIVPNYQISQLGIHSGDGRDAWNAGGRKGVIITN